MKKLFILVIILTSCALLKGGAAVYKNALPKNPNIGPSYNFNMPKVTMPNYNYGANYKNTALYNQYANKQFINPAFKPSGYNVTSQQSQAMMNQAKIAAMQRQQYSTQPAGQQPIKTSSWWSNIKDAFIKMFYGQSGQDIEADRKALALLVAQKRAKIEQEFLPVIESLSKGDTNFKSPHIKFGYEREGAIYTISYYIDGELIGSQKYVFSNYVRQTADKTIPTGGYLVNIRVKAAYRGYGIGRLLIKAALAHLKSQGVKKISLTRGIGDYYASPKTLDKLFKSLGFKKVSLFGNEYELYL